MATQNLASTSTRSLTSFSNPFLDALSVAERERIFGLAEEVAGYLRPWAAPHAIVRQARILPLALSVSAAAPFASLEALVDTARVSLWVFAADDLFDESDPTAVPLAELADQFCRQLAQPDAADRSNPYSLLLQDVQQRLMVYPNYARLGELWVAALQGTLREMAQELAWREAYQANGRLALPTYTEYLKCGRYSIGGPPHIWAAMLTLADTDIPFFTDEIGHMEAIASTAIRLANDLQSYAKEKEEGKFNAVTILTQPLLEQGLTVAEALPAAQQSIQAEIKHSLRRLRTLKTLVATKNSHPADAIMRIARFVCQFYLTHDFHTFEKVLAKQHID